MCFEGRERASGSDEPDTEMPRWPALSSPSSAILSLLQGVLHSGYQAVLFLESKVHYPHLVLGTRAPKDRDNVCFSACCVSLLGLGSPG